MKTNLVDSDRGRRGTRGLRIRPTSNDQLDEARAQVQTLSQDPLASQAASRELTPRATSCSRPRMRSRKRVPRKK